jgi:hypothetical protein
MAERLEALPVPAAEGLAGRIGAAAAALRERRGPRVLLVVQGGPGGGDGAGLEDPTIPALESALQAGVVVYSLTLDAGGEVEAPEALRDATERSGGVFRVVRESAGLARALAEVAAELGHRYLIAISPAEDSRPGWRAIKVRLRGRDGGVRAPRSLYVP